jgi:hypothetical protein
VFNFLFSSIASDPFRRVRHHSDTNTKLCIEIITIALYISIRVIILLSPAITLLSALFRAIYQEWHLMYIHKRVDFVFLCKSRKGRGDTLPDSILLLIFLDIAYFYFIFRPPPPI